MNAESLLLIWTAISVGCIHTLIGPDHYLPFIALANSRHWSRFKTVSVTLFCGFGHILSSLLIAAAGLILGKSIFSIEALNSFRGDFAAWLLIIFGFSYLVYGIFEAIKNVPHKHLHVHENGSGHVHGHVHKNGHVHVHEKKGSLTPWVLFIIFFLGPCEALIPLVMYPAAKGHIADALFVALFFSISTIATMTGVVIFSLMGLSGLHLKKLERFGHAIAGSIILSSGLGVKFLGL